MAPRPQLQLPHPFGAYELLESLPAGGMAEVYKARNPRLDTLVAIKILRADADAEMGKRFEEEARTLARLSHPHVVKVFDASVFDGRPHMVMEYLDGCDLAQVIAEGRIPDLVSQLRIALQIAHALEYVNNHGVLHRDIKPGNIFVCEPCDAKIIDFGIAKSDASPKTQAGFALGTLRYMAPEQLNGQTSPVLDVYAFGTLLYELITGQCAVPGTTLGEVTANVLSTPPDPEPLIRCGTPQPVIRLIQQCMEKSPEDRPEGFGPVCAELKRSISALTSIQPTAPAPLTREPPGERKRAVYLGTVAVALALITGVAMYSREKPFQPVTTGSATLNRTPPALPAAVPGPRGEMLLVSAGSALTGAGNKQVDVPAYYLDKTEVTVAAWSDYCRAASCLAPQGDPALPVVEVTYEEAARFCRESGKRLPTAIEWEKAARGADGFHYPWGNTKDPNRANHSGKIAPAGKYAASASPNGALDLSGNVWEWVDQSRAPSAEELGVFRGNLQPPVTGTEPWKAVYGGSFSTKLAPVWDFALVPARWKDETIGFRCAKTPSE